MRIRQNKRERAVIEYYQNHGYEVLVRGWPDLICYKDGQVLMVEVKRKQKRITKQMGLTRYQIRVHELLRMIGANVKVIHL